VAKVVRFIGEMKMASARRWGYGFLALAGAVVVAAIILFAFFRHFGGTLDKGSKELTDSSILAMSEGRARDTLMERASTNLKEHLDDSALAAMASGMTGMGKLVKYEGSQGESHTAISPGKETEITAHYVANADYERGSLKFVVDLVFVKGEWKIDKLNIQRAS
jgi:hypothetical protein